MSRLQWNAKERIFKIRRASKKSGEDVSISHSIRSSCCFPCNFRGDRSRTRSEIKDVSRGVACEETIPRIRDANTSPMLIAGRKAVGPCLRRTLRGNIRAESRGPKNTANPFRSGKAITSSPFGQGTVRQGQWERIYGPLDGSNWFGKCLCMYEESVRMQKEGTRTYVGTDFSHCLNGESMKFCGKLDCTWVKVNPRKFPSVKEYIYIYFTGYHCIWYSWNSLE